MCFWSHEVNIRVLSNNVEIWNALVVVDYVIAAQHLYVFPLVDTKFRNKTFILAVLSA